MLVSAYRLNSTIIRRPQTFQTALIARHMSAESVAKLPKRIQRFVQGFEESQTTKGGGGQADVAAVSEWVDKIASGLLEPEGALKVS